VAVEIKWEWMANYTTRIIWLQNVPWSWISGHSQNAGTEVANGMVRIQCLKFWLQWRKTRQSKRKKIFDHKNSAVHQPCITIRVKSKEEKLQKAASTDEAVYREHTSRPVCVFVLETTQSEIWASFSTWHRELLNNAFVLFALSSSEPTIALKDSTWCSRHIDHTGWLKSHATHTKVLIYGWNSIQFDWINKHTISLWLYKSSRRSRHVVTCVRQSVSCLSTVEVQWCLFHKCNECSLSNITWHLVLT
jgi:hypothetical protein